MEHTWLLHNLIVALGLLEECAAFPIHLGAGGVWSSGVAQGVASPLTPIALGAATLLAAAVLLVGCVCCRQQKGFQEKICMQDGSCKLNGGPQLEQAGAIKQEKVVALSTGKQDGQEVFVQEIGACNGKEILGVSVVKEFSDSVLSSQNNLASAPTSIQGSCYAQRSTAELTLFPPLGTTLTQPGDRSSIVQFEPLPDIHVVAAAAAAARRKPAAFGNSLHHGLSVHDWFEEPIDNFPRHQLQYLRELGRGWFGRVVEGKAKDIVSGHATSKVVVKILHEDATPTDQSYFLHEAKPYRNLKHPNVLSLVGRCLETHPFLLLLENCPYGTLKTFLTAESNNVEKLGKQGVLLEMACGMAVGLHHLVENGFVHTDLAARNCLVTSDLTVKVGDYGTSIETFKDEYYCVGDLAIPIRWVAPETLHCTDTTIETKEVTASANVWSLAIVLWEICEFGQLPYSNLSDDEVIEQVLGSCSTCLPFPTHENQLHVHNLYHLMKICWVEADKRPPLWRVVAMLQHLLQHKHSPAHTSANNNNNNSTTSLDDFERRWELSKPNTVPKIDNQLGTSSMHSSPVKSIPVQRSASLEETAVAETPVQLELNTSADRSFAAACANSPQLSVSSSISDVFISSSLLADHKSPSLQNLRGSVDNLQVEGTKENVLDKSSRLGQETLTEEPDFDSWLKGMDTTTEEDVRFVRNISEVIRDLDEVLAQEKTSSSSQNSSAQPSPSQLTLREMKPDMNVSASQDQKFTLDFRLGQAAASSVLLSRNIELLHSNGHESLSLSQHRLESSGSDTEDETWRMRIERGEFSEKVKEKSKSVADLMVLTHIEYSDGSDSDTTLDLDSCGSSFRKNGSCRRSFHRKPLQSSLSVTYGSEGNIHQAVLGEEFQETIKRLQESLRDGSKLEAIPDASLSCISSSSNEVQDNSCLTQSHSEKSNFLAKLASEKNILKNDPSCTALSDLSSLQTPDNLEENRRVMFSCQAKQEKPIESSENGSPGSILGSSQFLDSDLGPAFTHNGSEVDSVESNLEGGYEKTHVLVNGLDRLMVKALTSEEVHKITPDLSSKVIVDPGRNHTANVLNKEERPPSPITGDIQLPHADTSCVILGPFEDSTLEYFKGLKTAFPTVKTLDYDVTNEMDIEENSIETWDKFLDHAMQAENCDFPSFSDLSFSKSETESPLSECHGAIEASDILGSSFEKVAPEKTKILNTNGLDIKRGTCYVNSDCETSKWLGKAVVHPSDSGVVSSDVDIREESPMLAAGIQGLVNSCLVVPSVHVTEATPISSGRTTPSDSKCETNDSICLANKNDFGRDLLPHSHTDLTPSPGQEYSATALDVSKDLCSISSTVGFVVPQIRMSGTNTQSFDPDLPCCNVNDKNLLSNSVMRNNNYLFSGRRDIKSGESFHDELASGCFINPEVDEVALDKHFKTVIPLFSKGFDSKEGDLHADLMEDEDEFGLGVTKNLTPDDERSSDSGFRDKGSLSESCEDACDEKYNLEDIEAELEEAFSKGVFARHDSPTSTKGLESDCDVVDESFSVTLIDVEKQREQKEADLNSLKDPCHRLDDLLRGRDQFQEHASVDVESSVDFFGTSPPLSPIPQSSGWYLHPPQSHDEAGSEPVSGNDSSYFSFSLDEEFVNAIRNELREKLPCAQMPREESQPQLSDEEEHSDQDLDADESPAGDRTSITISYKSYPAPLSPILEEQESMCSDIGSPICGYDSSAYSEPMSPVFAVDHSASNQGDCDVKHVESECPAEVDGDLSDDCADCGDFDEISEHDCPPLSLVSHSLCTLNNLAVAHNICLDVDDEGNELDDDDVLVVNMETNEATILESPKPLDKFSVDGNDDCDEFNHDDFVPDFLSVAGSYQLPESNIERIRSDLYRGNRSMTLSALPQSSVGLELEDENDAMTPDSITCEKSFSERTEDSAVGLALSEIMTPDSLAGDSPWTSTQMCDSGFGTIGTRPSSSAMMSDSSERKSPVNIDDVSPIDQSSVSKESFSPQMSTEKEISKQYFLECPEISKTINCSDEGESSVSFSFDSVIDPDHITLKPSEGLKSSDPVEQKVSPSIESSDKECDEMKICDFLNGEENSLNAVRKEHCKSVPIPESALPPALSCISPQSLKEIACYVLGNDWKSKNQTLAFNNEDVMKNRQQSSVVAFGSKRNCEASVNEPHSAKECDFVINGLKKTTVEQSRPLQTLAFSDSDATERSSFPGAGHIVVSSIVTPLTPSDDTSTPGTLAFNESPESPSDVMSPMFKDSDNTEAESHLMSTSFMSADDLYDDRDRYTPDWESGSDGCESETASSSSGEFIWKDGEKESSLKAFQATPDTVAIGTSEDQTYNQNPPEFPMSAILEEEEERSGSSSCTSDSEDDAEFVPSAWDSQATPSRSALRSPDKKAEQKKNVSFKRQRYHCVYEYPRELSDSDGSDFADSPSRRRTWDLEGGSYSLHGWDLATNEGMTETHEEIRDGNALQSSTSQKLFEFYKINSTNCTFGSTMLSEDGEFFISSSAQPFHTLGEVGPAGSNEFFPGRDLSGSNDPDVDGNIDSNPTLLQLAASTETQNWEQPEEFSDSDSSDTYMVTASEGSFNQQRSSDSNSSLTPMVTANGSSKSSDDSSIYHSLPTNQELQVDSGSDSPLSELSPTSPLSPISPSHGLGELRHTRDRLKLDLPASNTTLVLVAPCKRRSVEQVRGEASLLDGEDIFEGSICKSTSPHLSENVPVGSDVH